MGHCRILRPRQPGFCLAEPMVIGCQNSGPPETHRTQLHPETSRNCKFFTSGNIQLYILYQPSVFQKFPKFSQPTFRNFQTCYFEMDTYGFLLISQGVSHPSWTTACLLGCPMALAQRFTMSPCYEKWSISMTALKSLVYH